MAKKDWLSDLQKMEGAVMGEYDPFSHLVCSPSPSLNYIFGNTWGLPLGYSAVIYGPPKGGKTIIMNAMIGQFLKDHPESYVVKYNTERRERVQLTREKKKLWGIDEERYQCFETNTPKIYDFIANDLDKKCANGFPLGLIVIDSMNAIQGRRAFGDKTVMTQQVGDCALTNKEGLKRVLEMQRKYNVSLLMTSHITAEMDMQEQKRGNKVKMASAFGVQHHAEYFIYAEPWRSKEGRTDFSGNELVNPNVLIDPSNPKKAEVVAHKIKVVMKDSSLGPKGRVGIFTLDYTHGIINVNEEVYLLAKNTGILKQPAQGSYQFGDKKWRGAEQVVQALKNDPELQKAMITAMKEADVRGLFAERDSAREARIDAENAETQRAIDAGIEKPYETDVGLEEANLEDEPLLEG